MSASLGFKKTDLVINSRNALKMSTTIPPHFRDQNEWSPLPDTETDRLQERLSEHLRNMSVRMTKPTRVEFVTKLLERQNGTCALGSNVGGMYCWNEPQYAEKPYLKLQWGHIKPRCRKEEQTPNDLFLVCARCNNQIQTSRHLQQLKAELLSKLEHIDMLISPFSA